MAELDVRYPVDRLTEGDKPPRTAVHDFKSTLMRDLFINGRLAGTLFCSAVETGKDLETSRHPSDHKNYQPVGFAAAFMS